MLRIGQDTDGRPVDVAFLDEDNQFCNISIMGTSPKSDLLLDYAQQLINQRIPVYIIFLDNHSEELKKYLQFCADHDGKYINTANEFDTPTDISGSLVLMDFSAHPIVSEKATNAAPHIKGMSSQKLFLNKIKKIPGRKAVLIDEVSSDAFFAADKRLFVQQMCKTLRRYNAATIIAISIRPGDPSWQFSVVENSAVKMVIRGDIGNVIAPGLDVDLVFEGRSKDV